MYGSKRPKLDLSGKSIKSADKFKFLELFGSKMCGIQEKVYNYAISDIIEKKQELDLSNQGVDNVMLLQLSDFVYPIPGTDIIKSLIEERITVSEFYGSNGISNSLTRKGTSYAYKDKSYPFFDRDFIKNHSAKMNTFQKSARTSKKECRRAPWWTDVHQMEERAPGLMEGLAGGYRKSILSHPHKNPMLQVHWM